MAMLAHRVLYLLGGVILVITVAGFNKYYNTLPDFRGLFCFKIACFRNYIFYFEKYLKNENVFS